MPEGEIQRPGTGGDVGVGLFRIQDAAEQPSDIDRHLTAQDVDKGHAAFIGNGAGLGGRLGADGGRSSDDGRRLLQTSGNPESSSAGKWRCKVVPVMFVPTLPQSVVFLELGEMDASAMFVQALLFLARAVVIRPCLVALRQRVEGLTLPRLLSQSCWPAAVISFDWAIICSAWPMAGVQPVQESLVNSAIAPDSGPRAPPP